MTTSIFFLQKHIPQRTKHRKQLPPWIMPSTSNLMKKLKTQRELLNKKPTNYRKLKVTKLENLVTELCENDRVAYQELLATRDTNLLFKHVKSLSKSATIPKVMSYAGRCSSNDIEKANMLNQYFHSVFSPRKDFCYRDVNPQHSTISNFSICKTKIFEILATVDVTKTRGPDGLPPLFFRKTATEMCKTLNTMFKAVKRNRKLPKA